MGICNFRSSGTHGLLDQTRRTNILHSLRFPLHFGLMILIQGMLFTSNSQASDPLEDLLPLTLGPMKIGGAVRFNYAVTDWNEVYDNFGEWAFDTARVNVDFTEAEPLIGSFEYRYYDTKHSSDSYHMLHHGWIGYRLPDDSELQLGVHRVPFGILPYASDNYWFQLPYYVGLEDDYDLGVKFTTMWLGCDIRTAYYFTDEGNWSGDSGDSARYSYDPVDDFEEQDHLNVRAAYSFEHSTDKVTEIGFSLQGGELRVDHGDDGIHIAVAAHLSGRYGRWGTKLEAIRYEYAEIETETITMGAYDASYNVATKGTIWCGGLSYVLPYELRSIKDITLYDNYSYFDKDNGFDSSQQHVAGVSFTLNRFFVYIDMATAKNHAWFGNWEHGLANANLGMDNSWNSRFNFNIGYYF